MRNFYYSFGWRSVANKTYMCLIKNALHISSVDGQGANRLIVFVKEKKERIRGLKFG